MIINKRVVVVDVNFLQFMFPNYRLVSDNTDISSICGPIIYKGDYSKVDEIIAQCNLKNLDYIVVSNNSEIDLNDRRTLANVLFEKWRHGVLPKYLEEIIDNIDKDDFIEAAKIKWVSGKWLITKLDDENTFLQLIDTLNKSKFSSINSYFNIISKSKTYRTESSLLTFISRAKTRNYKGTSFEYKKKLEIYKGDKLNSTLNAISDSLDYNIDNEELRLLNLFMKIQDSTKK